MTIPFVFRKPRLPVIIVAGDRVFRAISAAAIQKLVRRELTAGAKVRLLDSNWAWFEVLTGDVEAIVPSFTHYQPPTKQTLITLVNSRANRAETDPLYEPRSLSSRSREEIYQELLGILPVG
jgi:hypothetical protein